MNLRKEYEILQTQINRLEDLKKPVDSKLYLRRIKILEQLDDEFVKSNQENIGVYTQRIRLNSMLEYFAKKLNLPIEKYTENIELLMKKMGV